MCDCMCKDTPFVPGDTSRSQWSARTWVPIFSAAYARHTVRHYRWGSHGLVDVRPHKQIICNTHFEQDIKVGEVVVEQWFSVFAIFNQLAKQQYRQS